MIGNLRGIVYLLILIALSRTALSQPASQATAQGASIAGTGSITGAVKLGDAPAAGITMALAPERMGRMAPQQQPQPEIANRAVTDEKGLYRFTNVAAGRFSGAPPAQAFVPTRGGGASGGPGGVVINVKDRPTATKIS